MLKRFILATSMGLAMLLVPATSQASTISYTIPYTCDGCHNTAFDITYFETDSASHTYAFTVTAWYAPADGAMDYTFINAIAMKLEGVSYATPTMVFGPDGGPWAVLDKGLNANGCSNGSGGGYFCANSAGVGAGHGGPGDSDTWVFLVDLTAPLGATQEVHFKGHFTDANGGKVGDLISDGFFATPGVQFDPSCNGPCAPTAVPEPASLLLMGAGLSLIAARLRNRAKR